ncbi:MAG: GTP 3',8-cyclase MoaA [Syntrophales bacterium]|jgi:cyclic pyranopterin phosphate synthase|nr:GTP 3',8-cyclase MoaA [Syntrophales bacterium]
MRDRFNRDINYLRVSVTDRCNLRCRYCMPKAGLSLIGHDDILRYEEMIRIVRVAVRLGVGKVRLTGGEPLVRRGLAEFIASLRKIEGLHDIGLTTNGILLEKMAPALYAAGLRRINVSLDSLDPEKYRHITRGGDLEAVIRGIRKARECAFDPIKINVVAIKGFNDSELFDFAALTLERPYQIRFIELMPLGEAGTENNGNFLSNDVIRQRIGERYALEPVNDGKNPEAGPAQVYRAAGGQGEIGFISPVTHHFCETCNRLRLTADGCLRACLLRDDEVDLKRPLRDGCSDADLEALIRGAIAKKPPRHELSRGQAQLKKCARQRDMSAIGG